MKVKLRCDLMDDEEYIVRQSGDVIEVDKECDNWFWYEYCPGVKYVLTNVEVEEI